MASLLPCVEIDPCVPPRWSVLWLHGLGADGHDFESLVPALRIPPETGVRFVFPNAPSIPVTINAGFVMPAWYDISDIDLHKRPDEDGIRASAARISDLVRRENSLGIPSERIVLAGFSQGGAIALHVGLRHPERLRGILALSAYLVCSESVAAERSEANLGLPIFQAHGTVDPMVAIARGTETRDRLIELGYAVEWHSYPMQHEVCPQEVQDLSAWLLTLLGEES